MHPWGQEEGTQNPFAPYPIFVEHLGPIGAMQIAISALRDRDNRPVHQQKTWGVGRCGCSGEGEGWNWVAILEEGVG